jgi:hypothetical protein
MNLKFSVCGYECTSCDYHKKSECPGCSEVKGKVWWTNFIGVSVCPIYDCVINLKKYKNCGICPEVPCKIWQDLKDPNLSADQHQASINNRITSLGKLNK